MKLQIKSWAVYLNLQVGVLFMSVGLMVNERCIPRTFACINSMFSKRLPLYWLIFQTMSLNVMIVTLKGHPEINDRYEYHVGVYSYMLVVLLTWFVAFVGAYLLHNRLVYLLQQNRHLIFAAIVLWTLFTVLWLCAVVLSHFCMKFGSRNTRYSSLCVDQRCAVSMWLFSNRHYDVFHDKIDYFYHSSHDTPKDVPVRDPFAIYDMTDFYDKDMRNTELIAAVLVFAICSVSTITLQLSVWILLYSYFKELQCFELFIPCDKICRHELPETIVAVN